MKKLAALTLSMFLVTGTAFADTPKNADSQPAKAAQPAKPKAAKKAEKSDAAIAAQLEELRQALQLQQEQLQMIKEELAKRDRQIDEAREAAAAANARASEDSTKATEAVNTTAEVKSTAVFAQFHRQRLESQQRSPQDHRGHRTSRRQESNGRRPVRDQVQGRQHYPGRLQSRQKPFIVLGERATASTLNLPAFPIQAWRWVKFQKTNFEGRQSSDHPVDRFQGRQRQGLRLL